MANDAAASEILLTIRLRAFPLAKEAVKSNISSGTKYPIEQLRRTDRLTASQGDIQRRGKIIRDFLKSPLNRQHFNAFFEECLRQTIYCLSSLRVRGYRLPMAEDGRAASLRDLAHSILGSLLRTERGKSPFHEVFDSFERGGIADSKNADAEQLAGVFGGLIWRFTKQELFKMSGQEDPLTANLKRRVGDVLKKAEYSLETASSAHVKHVSLVAHQDKLRLDCPNIASETLHRLVEAAYFATNNMSQLCASVFAHLHAMTEVQNRLRKHELVSAVVAVVLRYIETDGFSAVRLSTPESDYDAVDMQKARETAVKHVRERVIVDFVIKKRITSDIGDRFTVAAEQYLLDLCAHGNADPIPQYFRENMPEEEHEQYLNKYKYVFETVINSAVEEFRSRLRD